MERILSSPVLFWMGWITIPLIVEIIPAIGNLFILLKSRIVQKNMQKKEIKFFPDISILVPVYNSAKTLEGCLKSINDSTYSNKYIEVLCIDNGSTDESFEIFKKVQMECPSLAMSWMKSKQGKSNALNMALFNCGGKYIINIDSDGQLEKNALYNLVRKFELNSDIACMTGTILTDPEMIEDTRKKELKFFRRLEYYEYTQSFLAGRNFQAETNSIFTLSGAFSAFRKDTILKSQMYNTDTICEDTQMTFQIKELLGEKIHYCADAIFVVDPIEDFNKFYTQRQRWQIGELEVCRMFVLKNMANPIKAVFDPMVRMLTLDHTTSFPRFIWYFVLIFLCIINRSSKIIVFSSLLIYVTYVITAYLYHFCVLEFLKNFDEYREYCKKHALLLIIYPFYNFVAFIVRFCGILNSITRHSTWKTLTIEEESEAVVKDIKDDFGFVKKSRNFFRKVLENDSTV